MPRKGIPTTAGCEHQQGLHSLPERWSADRNPEVCLKGPQTDSLAHKHSRTNEGAAVRKSAETYGEKLNYGASGQDQPLSLY